MLGRSVTSTDLPDGKGSAARPTQLLYWDETTRARPFTTGVERVVRGLRRALIAGGYEIVSVGWDRKRRLMRRVVGPRCNPTDMGPDAYDFSRCKESWLLIPEIPIDAVYDRITPAELGRAYGLRTAAIIHDIIPVKLAGDYDGPTAKHYERYYRMFATADLVIGTTDYVARDLRAYLQGHGLRLPDIAVHPLPAQFAWTDRHLATTMSTTPGHPLRLLTISSWEPRKNLPRLLRSINQARNRVDRPVELTVIGRRGGFAAYTAEVEALLSEMPNVVVMEGASDESLVALYESHHASVYPSFEEGFGLPILESLWLATPCLCHNASSMAEIAPGGGTMTIDMTDETAIRDAVCRLAEEPDLLPRLSAEIAVRPLASWTEYGKAIASSLERAAMSPEAAKRARGVDPGGD